MAGAWGKIFQLKQLIYYHYYITERSTLAYKYWRKHCKLHNFNLTDSHVLTVIFMTITMHCIKTRLVQQQAKVLSTLSKWGMSFKTWQATRQIRQMSSASGQVKHFKSMEMFGGIFPALPCSKMNRNVSWFYSIKISLPKHCLCHKGWEESLISHKVINSGCYYNW